VLIERDGSFLFLKNDFAVHDFVKIFRINPAVIDSRYRAELVFLVDAAKLKNYHYHYENCEHSRNAF
jgi:hypothetical protein